tara:strand:+ start:335 stop:514 length:180 start_codon:yes stop_codon:yes gene_type:complete
MTKEEYQHKIERKTLLKSRSILIDVLDTCIINEHLKESINKNITELINIVKKKDRILKP